VVSLVSDSPIPEPRGLIFRRMLRTASVIVTGSDEAARVMRQFATGIRVIPSAAPLIESRIRRDNRVQRGRLGGSVGERGA